MTETSELKSMQDFRQYLREVTAIQGETIRRLVHDDSTPPLEVAAVLEDVANQFLDISDEIRDLALGRTEAGLRPLTARPGEAGPV